MQSFITGKKFLLLRQIPLHSRGKGCNQRDALSPWAHPFFLAAAEEQRGNFYTLSDIQSSYTFGGVDFMAADAEQVGVCGTNGKRQFERALHRVDMDQCTRVFLPHRPDDLLNRVACTNLVIDKHDRYKGGMVVHRIEKLPGSIIPGFIRH